MSSQQPDTPEFGEDLENQAPLEEAPDPDGEAPAPSGEGGAGGDDDPEDHDREDDDPEDDDRDPTEAAVLHDEAPANADDVEGAASGDAAGPPA